MKSSINDKHNNELIYNNIQSEAPKSPTSEHLNNILILVKKIKKKTYFNYTTYHQVVKRLVYDIHSR